MRWSNGDAFGPDDLLFWYNDVMLNKDITPAIAARYISGGKPLTMTKVDDVTVKITFAAPSGLFVQVLATPDCAEISTRRWSTPSSSTRATRIPPSSLRWLQENKVDDWVKLFQSKVTAVPGTPVNGRWWNKDLPSMYSWFLTTPYGSGKDRVAATRNPYYWKVDTEGNQLPYVDNIWYDYVKDIQVWL